MGKITLFAVLILAGLVILNKEKVADYKRRAIEAVNPAAKEKRLLGELEVSLSELDSLLSGGSSSLSKDSENKKAKTALNSIKKTIDELKETNGQTDLAGNLSNLIQKIIPLDSKPSATWLPPGQTCK